MTLTLDLWSLGPFGWECASTHRVLGRDGHDEVLAERIGRAWMLKPKRAYSIAACGYFIRDTRGLASDPGYAREPARQPVYLPGPNGPRVI